MKIKTLKFTDIFGREYSYCQLCKFIYADCRDVCVNCRQNKKVIDNIVINLPKSKTVVWNEGDKYE